MGQVLMDELEQQLRQLLPTTSKNIIDVVEDAGIDTSPWQVKSGGEPIATPASNPKFCYEWAFGGGPEPTLVCIWHDSLAIKDGMIVYEDAPRQFAAALDRVSSDPTKDSKVRQRAAQQAPRAYEFDRLLQHAYRGRKPVRVVVVDGIQPEVSELGHESSHVRTRLLDSASWFVHAYDVDSGRIRVVRGQPALEVEPNPIGTKFVDQIHLPDPPEKISTSGSAYVRSEQVRAIALDRANGRCERCKQPGFKTAKGPIFLETHHVVPLSEGGPDEEWNVVAICANDHREAHHGVHRHEIQKSLLRYLRLAHPSAAAAIEEMAKAHATRIAHSRGSA
jgi:5-methylcytosine-specific restriction protein A